MAISEQGRKKWEEIKKKNEQRWAAEENSSSSASQNARKNKAIAAANSKIAAKNTVVKPNAKSVSTGKRGQPVMVTDAGERAVQSERAVAAARQKAIADAKAAADARWAAGEEGRQRITKPGASRAVSGKTNQSVMVSDTGTGDATAERNARKERYRAEYDALSRPVNAAYQTGKNVWSAELLDDYSRMQELSKKMKTIDLLNEYADKESGFFGSNYDLGELGELSNLAWFDAYNGAQSDADEEYARYIDNIINSYSGNNQDSFSAKGIASDNSPDWVKQLNDLAVDTVATTVQYIPQLKNQIMESIAPALLGAYAGGRTGFNIGRSFGSAVHSYKSMSGAAYKEMRNLGLNHDAAQRLAGDEAFISSIIEFADTFLESMSHGYGKIANKLGIPSLLGDGAKRAAKTGGVAGKLLGLGQWGVNTLQEGSEEGTQEAVSIANENRALSGYNGEDESFFPRVWGLVKDAAPIWWDSTKGLFTGDAETDYAGRIWDATKGGMQVGAVMGALGMGSSYLANTLLDNTVNADPRYMAVREGTAAQAQSLSDGTEATVQQPTATEGQAGRQTQQTAAEQEPEPVTPEIIIPTQEQRENGVASMNAILEFLGYPGEEPQQEGERMESPIFSEEIDRQSAPVRETQPGTEMNPVRTANSVDMSDTAELQRLAAEMDQRQQIEDAIRAQQEADAFEAAQTAIYQQQNQQRWARSRETVEQRSSGLAESAATDKWSRQDVATVDKMARQLGVKVYTENARNIGGGAGEGSIAGNVVLLDESMDATEAIRRVAGHEFGHRMKDLAPKEFDIYVAAVREAVPDFNNLVERKQALMQANHLDASVAAATEEVAADYAGRLMSDGDTMEQFIQQNQHRPSLLKRMAEAFRELWRKLTGKERTQAEEAAYRLEKAYEKAVKEAKRNATQAGGGEGKYSISRQSLRTDGELEAAVLEIQQQREAGEISAEEAREQISELAQRAAENNPDFEAIKKENQQLLRKVEQLKKQMTLTTNRSVRQADTDRVANELLKDFSSRANRADIKQAVYALANKIHSAKNTADVWESATVDAQAILWEVVENATALNDTLAEEYRDIKQYLRSTPLVLSETDSHDINDLAALKKSMRGTMRISVGEAGNVDRIFTDMAERWPGYFNAEATTHPAAMVERIADVMDMLKPAFENPFSSNMEAAVQEGANALLETLVSDAVREEAPTFADRQKAKYEEKLKNAIQKERDKRTEAVAKAKEAGKRELQRRKQQREKTETRAKIKRHTQAMSTKLLKPTDTKHVPTDLQTAVAKLLESINLDSGRDSKNREKRVRAMAELKSAYQQILMNNDSDIVVNPDLLGDDSSGFTGLFDTVIAMGDKSIYEMTQSELNTVWAVVRSLETAISNAGKALANQKAQTIRDMANSFALDVSQRRPKPQKITNALRQDMMNPYSFFHQFGETASSIWRELRNAQDMQTVRIQEIAEKVQNKISPQLMQRAQKTVHTFDLVGDEKLTLTNAQIMNLYNLIHRQQALDHLLKGGVVQPEVKVGKIRVSRGTEMLPLSLRDLHHITDVLSADEKAAAEALQALTGDMAVWGNEASEKAYGYQKFTEKNYWPIKSAQEALHSNVEKGQNNTRSIKNIGMAKNTVPHARTAIELGDIFDVFSQHTADMIDYSTWLLPMEDVNRFFNHKYVNDDGLRTGKTVKGMLERIGGKGSQAYWMRLMEDLQNGIHSTADTQAEKIANKIVGNAKAAAVGANIRVILQQPTAFARAYAVMDPFTAMHGIFSRGVTGGNGWEKAQKYSGVGLIKAIGGFDQGNARSVKQQLFGDSGFMRKINDISAVGAEAADAIAWGWLWNAAEWQAKKENPNLRPGSNAFYHKTSEIFTDVIEQTQVVDGILQRTQIMRSGNAFNKQASSFMGEPLTTLNLLMRSWDDVRYSTDKSERNQARRRLARSLFVVAFTSVVNAAVQSVPDAVRDDDKEESWWNRFLNALLGFTSEDDGLLNKSWKFVIAGNIGSNLNPAGWIPYMNDVLSMIQGFDVTRADADVISDVVKNAQDLWSAAQGDGSKQPIYVAKRLMTSVATMLGVPVKSLTRDIWSVVLMGFEAAGQWETVYELTKVLYKPGHQSNRSRYMSLLYRAKQESPEDYNKIRQDILYNGYFESTGSAAQKKTPAVRRREAEKKIDDGVKKLEDEANRREEAKKS